MKKLFFLPALAAMMFSSCSSDEPTVDNPTDQVGERYVAVTIKNVGSIGGRATSTENGETFEEGIDKESSITAENLRFYFFTSDGRPFIMNSTGVNGTVSNTNMVAPTAINTSSTTNGKVTDIQATLVLGKSATEPYVGNEPAYVFCIANPTVNFDFTDFANTRMSEIYRLADEIHSTSLTSNSTFFMTSSTYGDAEVTTSPFETGSKVIFFTNLDGKIKNTVDDAKANPAEIYLERLASKVRVMGLDIYTVKEKQAAGNPLDAVFNIKYRNADGTIGQWENQKLSVELTGWRLRNVANTVNAIKHIENSWMTTAPFEGWNLKELHRSFWATSKAASENDVELATYDIYDTANDFKLGNYASATPSANIAYCYENTMQPNVGTAAAPINPMTDRTSSATAIVVRGVVKMPNEEAGLDLCMWGGDFYTEDALKQMIIDNYNQGKNEADKLTYDKVGFAKYTETDAKANTWYAYVKTQSGNIHNNFRFHDIKRWISGQTSYYVNIEHMGGKYGVVRNHIYEYTFSNVIGLGVPGNDPKNPDPETQTYLAARVMVLNWHLLSKNIVLE